MAGSAAGTWGRLMGVRFRLVVLSSAYPPGECLRRLASGHLAGLVPAVLAPLALAAFIAGLRAANLRLPQRRGAELLRDVTEILGPAASAGPAAGRSSA